MPLTAFLICFETADGRRRSFELQAPSRDAAIQKWDRIRQPGDFIESIGPVFRMQWPD
jgi:hypothetical protein